MKRVQDYFEACAGLALQLRGDGNTGITGITDDSRQVEPGSLFVAVAGSQYDGRRYATDAVARGAAAIVYGGDLLENLPVPSIRVSNDYAACARLAEFHYGYPARGLTLVAITGTNGKSTTAALLREILLAGGNHPGIIGTIHHDTGLRQFPSSHTTPPPLQLQKLLVDMHVDGADTVILEVSSHALMQHRLGTMQFDAAVFTNLTPEHLDYHESMENYYTAKKRLFVRHLKPRGVALINIDDPYGRCLHKEMEDNQFEFEETMALQSQPLRMHTPPSHHPPHHPNPTAQFPLQQMVPTHPNTPHTHPTTPPAHPGSVASERQRNAGRRLFSFSFHSGTGAQLTLNDRLRTPSGAALTIGTPGGAMHLRTERVAVHDHYNILAAAAAAYAIGLPCAAIETGVERFSGIPGRMERIADADNVDVYIDYAHTEHALLNALTALRQRSAGRIIVVFGCGGDRDRSKRPRMGAVAARLADAVILTNDNPRSENPVAIMDEIRQGMPAALDYRAILDRRDAIRAALTMAGSGDTVLVAGKGHECYQESDGIKTNFNDAEVCRHLLRELAHAPVTMPTERFDSTAPASCS